MEKIKSFQVDHTKFGVGMYISRIDEGIVTYDLRMVIPNGGEYLSNPSMHTVEHLLATYVRSSKYANNIVYAGPMGCRTGFYLLTTGVTHQEAIDLVKDSLRFISTYYDEIPGCSVAECGNYLEHDLVTARQDVLPLLNRLEEYTVQMLDYNWHIN